MNNFRTRSTRRSRRNIIAGLVAAQAVTGVGLAWTAHAAPSTTRVSVDSAGQQANGASATPAVNIDGTVIAFSSRATTCPAQTPRARSMSVTRCRDEPTGEQAGRRRGRNDDSVDPAISGTDGWSPFSPRPPTWSQATPTASRTSSCTTGSPG